MNSQEFFRILVCFVVLHYSIAQKVPIWQCNTRAHHTFCNIEEFNETHPFYEIKSNVPAPEATNIILSGFLGSRMHLLSNTVCEKFPYAEFLNADSLELKVVEPNAFLKCRRMQRLYLRKNFLSQLHPDQFKENSKLRYLGLSNNQFTAIDTKWFKNTPILEEILIANNLLTEFPIKEIRPLKHLDILYLQGNQIADLDEKEMSKKFPKLREVSLCNNPKMNSDRQKAITQFLRNRNVTVLCEADQPFK